MIAVFKFLTPEDARRKAMLARRRSKLIWSNWSFLPLADQVRIEARLTLHQSIGDYWRTYRGSSDPLFRSQCRSYLRAKVTAFRLLAF